MSVIAEPCIGTKDIACIDVCQIDCIHPTKEEPDFKSSEQLYINPEVCIDCHACEPVYPVSAIFPEDELPEKWKQFAQKNTDYYNK